MQSINHWRNFTQSRHCCENVGRHWAQRADRRSSERMIDSLQSYMITSIAISIGE